MGRTILVPLGTDGSDTNLGSTTGAFSGRVDELAVLDRLLDGGRLVTITGPPGIGKTRLALRHGERCLGGRSGAGHGGVWFCDLTEVRDGEAVCGSVLRAIGVVAVEGAQETSADVVGRELARRGRALVILDNFEQILRHAPGTVGAWIDRSPRTHFLVTSRERLSLPGERVLDLGPLGLPDGPASLAASEAGGLLLDLVRRWRYDYSPNRREAETLVRILHELDGIPLAIELAAGRMDVLGPDELLERLRDRFEILRGNTSGAARWERSMRGAIDWSWLLLTAAEQSALMQCAVFRGGFDLDAAEEVISLDVPSAATVLDVVQSLRAKSMLHVTEVAAFPGRLRIGLFRSICEFVAEELEQRGGRADAESRHTKYFERLARDIVAGLSSDGADEWRGRLVVEQENLTAVVERCLAVVPATRQSVVAALNALLAIDLGSRQMVPLVAHARRLDAALRAASAVGLVDTLTARAHEARAYCYRKVGRGGECVLDLEEAIRIAGLAGDPQLEGDVLRQLAAIRALQRNAEESIALYERAILAARRASDLRGEVLSLASLAHLHTENQRCGDAVALLERAVGLLPGAASRRAGAIVAYMFALARRESGDRRAVADSLERALADFRAIEDRWFVAACLYELALLRREESQLEAAEALLLSGRASAAGLDPRVEALIIGQLAAVAAEQGEVDRASALFEEVGPLLTGPDLGVYPVLLEVLRGSLDLARSIQAAAAGDPEEAARQVEHAAGRLEASAATAATSLDVRLARRLLGAALQRVRGSLLPSRDAAAEHDALVVQVEGRWLKPPGGRRIDCHRRDAVRRLLLRLAQQRLAEPGRALSSATLVLVGWPSQRMRPEAARNRLHVALSMLRRLLGPNAALLRTEDGYLLDPAVLLRMTREP